MALQTDQAQQDLKKSGDTHDEAALRKNTVQNAMTRIVAQTPMKWTHQATWRNEKG